ncbi:MAG: hypothetical protein ABFD50_06150 [Smithella sp.]
MKIVVSLMDDKVEKLKEQAEKEGLTLSTYCRMILSRQANE